MHLLAQFVSWPDCGRSAAKAGGESEGVVEVQHPDGAVRTVELHWYEATGIGRKEYKSSMFEIDQAGEDHLYPAACIVDANLVEKRRMRF